MKRNLVIGASGLVGEHLVNALAAAGNPPIATFRTNPIANAEQLDICEEKQVQAFFKQFQPDVVFLPASLTNVDWCEANPDLSYQTNVLGVKNIVDACNNTGARLIYFSSDYIFDGSSGPYDEKAVANPISAYGQQKLIAEHTILATSLNALIVRTTVVYGWERQGKNFIYRLLKSLQSGQPVRVPKDQVGTPTYAPELAQNVVKLSEMDFRGVVNVTGTSCISRYEFALEAAAIFGLPQNLILPVTTLDLNQVAKRPLSAGLKTNLAVTLLKTDLLSSAEGLQRLLALKTDFQGNLKP